MVPKMQMRPMRTIFMFLLMPSPSRLKGGISGLVGGRSPGPDCLLRRRACVEKGDDGDGPDGGVSGRGRDVLVVVVMRRWVRLREATERNMVVD